MQDRPEDVRHDEKLAGLLLIGAAALALIAANSTLAPLYHQLLDARIGPAIPRLGHMSVHHWVADGLMATFFLLVGLEVKREWYDGRLATPAERTLPMIAAGAGMAVPALIYLAVTGFHPELWRGWAIPAATDIAFAVGVLALLGTRANPSIKLLLVAIAIVDDIGAVMIIALAYTASLNILGIMAALLVIGALAAMNRSGVRRLSPYLVGFALLWGAMLASGIHATIAGVLAAFIVPFGTEDRSPLKLLEHRMHPWVMFGVMPLFGLVSAGVDVRGVAEIFQPLPLAIVCGLFIGKQLGVFGAIRLAVAAGICERPAGTRWLQLYGAALLCGIGFTMSLFIGALAFPNTPELADQAKLGTLAGSLLSAICGWAVLRFTKPVPADEEDAAEAFEIFAADQPEPERA